MLYSFACLPFPILYLRLSKEGTWKSSGLAWYLSPPSPFTWNAVESIFILRMPLCWSPAAPFGFPDLALPSWSSLASPRAAAPAAPRPAAQGAGSAHFCRAVHLLPSSAEVEIALEHRHSALVPREEVGLLLLLLPPRRRLLLPEGNSSQAGEGEAPENPLQLRKGKPPPGLAQPLSFSPSTNTDDESDSLPKVSHWWEWFLSSFLERESIFPPLLSQALTSPST